MIADHLKAPFAAALRKARTASGNGPIPFRRIQLVKWAPYDTWLAPGPWWLELPIGDHPGVGLHADPAGLRLHAQRRRRPARDQPHRGDRRPAAGVRDRSLDAILFSQDDPTPRAPQIISTLQAVFPPALDRFVFGPMAQIGWGTPTIITIEIALILELPSPLRLVIRGG